MQTNNNTEYIKKYNSNVIKCLYVNISSIVETRLERVTNFKKQILHFVSKHAQYRILKTPKLVLLYSIYFIGIHALGILVVY